MLEAIGAGSSRRIGNKDWADIWNESEEFGQVKEEIRQLNEAARSKPEERLIGAETECKRSA